MNLLDYDIEVEDTATANYEFEDRVTGLYFATNAYAVNSTVELEVITEKRRFSINDNKLVEYNFNNEEGILIAEDEMFESTKSYYGLGHKVAIQSFYQAVIDDSDDYITIDDALNSMLMVDMLKLSSEEKRKTYAKEFM